MGLVSAGPRPHGRGNLRFHLHRHCIDVIAIQPAHAIILGSLCKKVHQCTRQGLLQLLVYVEQVARRDGKVARVPAVLSLAGHMWWFRTECCLNNL